MSESQIEANQRQVERYYGPQMARVVDVADPLGKHRVRLTVPGIIQRSDWAFPLVPGAGAERGGAPAHKVGDIVICLFHGGDPQGTIFVLGGFWNTTGAPSSFEGLSPEDAPLVHPVVQIGGYMLAVDERSGSRQAVLHDEVLGDMIQMNGELGEITIRASSGVRVVCDGAVEIEAASVTINGRQWLVDSKPG